MEINRHLREVYPHLVDDVVQRLDAVGASVTRDTTTDLLLINGEYSASMVLSRCRQTAAGSFRWLIAPLQLLLELLHELCTNYRALTPIGASWRS